MAVRMGPIWALVLFNKIAVGVNIVESNVLTLQTNNGTNILT